jgi:hypothetical protein
LEKVLDKHRQGIVVKQVAAGREFQGCPFYSKPDVIHFKVSELRHHHKSVLNKMSHWLMLQSLLLIYFFAGF